jgi:endonuclease/exonuclease/phosphatase family metal-dependent hydrolase
LRLLTYNIRQGGAGRVDALAEVVNACAADLVVLQEAHLPPVVERLAAATGMTAWASHPGHSVAFMSRIPIREHRWHRPPPSKRAFLEIVPEGTSCRVFGLHLSAVHSNWTERRRARELRAFLQTIAEHQHGFHLLLGDFNTLAPGETLDLAKLPPRLRAVVWLTGRAIRWHTIQLMLDASYADGYRTLHPRDPGCTFLSWDPHIRLDYLFLPAASAGRLRSCEVVDGGRVPAVTAASDHLPLCAEVEVD